MTLTHLKRCGRELYDDYKEVQPGALTNLEKLLTSYFGGHAVTLEPGDFEPPIATNGSNRNKTLGYLMSAWKCLFGNRQRDARLPWTRQSRDDMDISSCSAAIANGRANHQFVLICLPFMRWAKKLHQLDMCNLQSDQMFFLSLRKEYSLVQKSRPWKSFARARRVTSLDFVKVSSSIKAFQGSLDIISAFFTSPRPGHITNTIFLKTCARNPRMD